MSRKSFSRRSAIFFYRAKVFSIGCSTVSGVNGISREITHSTNAANNRGRRVKPNFSVAFLTHIFTFRKKNIDKI